MTNEHVMNDASSLTVRRASPADAAMLAQLGARTFRETYASENTPENMAAYVAKAFDAAVIARELADPAVTYLVGEMDGQPAAYAIVGSTSAPKSVTGASASVTLSGVDVGVTGADRRRDRPRHEA